MTYPRGSSGEHPSTYFVQDRSNQEELRRLQIQDHLLTIGMGGVLPEQPDPARFASILDVGCGTGGWLIETAQTYPTTIMLRGVDVSKPMVMFARAQAEQQQINARVEFLVMDALRMLEFPTASFDLANQRSAVSYLRTWDWRKILDEYRRVLRPGGVIRITEPEMVTVSSSPALTHLFDLLLKAFFQAGHLYTPTSDGLTSQLPTLLERAGFRQIETRLYPLVQRTGTPEAQQGAEDIKLLFRTIIPFLTKWGRVPDNYAEVYQQAMDEIRQPDFVATSRLLTVWGTNP